MNLNSIKNLLERFSCSLVGGGNKITGHKMLLESLLALRKKDEKILFSLVSQKNRSEKVENRKKDLEKNNDRYPSAAADSSSTKLIKGYLEKQAILLYRLTENSVPCNSQTRLGFAKDFSVKRLKRKPSIFSNRNLSFHIDSISKQRNQTKIYVSLDKQEDRNILDSINSSPLQTNLLGSTVERREASILNKKTIVKQDFNSNRNKNNYATRTYTVTRFSPSGHFKKSRFFSTQVFVSETERDTTFTDLRKKESLSRSPKVVALRRKAISFGNTALDALKLQENHVNERAHENGRFSLKLNNNKICQLCIDKVKPILETRKIRKGRITHKVPMITNPRRQEGKAITLLVENASFRKTSPSKRFAQIESRYNPIGKSNLVVPSSLFSNRFRVLHCTSNSFRSSAKENLDASFSVNKVADSKPLTVKERNEKSHLKDPSSFLNTSLKIQDKSSFYPTKLCLAEEFWESMNGKSESIEKKKQLHVFALQNRASLHFRWW